MDEYFDINSICQRLWYFFITVLVIVIISITVVFLLNKINKRYHSNNDNDARRFTATENITNEFWTVSFSWGDSH